MVTPGTARQPRKDALANRAHILAVATRAFAEDGVNVSIDAIARRAGIGSATLYRNFPTKDALLAALLGPHHERLMARSISIEEDAGDAGSRLQRWIDALGDWMLAYEGLPEPLKEAWSAEDSPLRPQCDDLIATTDNYLRAAQREGFARPDLSGRDVFLGALAMAWASERSSARENARAVLGEILRDGWTVRER